jgi:hypothetical protein
MKGTMKLDVNVADLLTLPLANTSEASSEAHTKPIKVLVSDGIKMRLTHSLRGCDLPRRIPPKEA